MTGTNKYAHELCTGDEYAPLDFTVGADLNQQFLFTIEDFDPIYLGQDDAPAQVHPMILCICRRAHEAARFVSPQT